MSWRPTIPMALVLIIITLGAPMTGAASVPEPSTAPPSYPAGTGVTFEPVSPSVWKVTEPDRDCPTMASYEGTEVAPDGRVWFLDRQRSIRELGACPILDAPGSFMPRDTAMGPDGTVWVLDIDRLLSWDGSAWAVRAQGRFNRYECTGGRTPQEIGEQGGSCRISCDLVPCVTGIDVAPDGTVWLSGTVLSSFDGTTWTDWLSDAGALWVLAFGPDGSVWVRGDGIFVIRPPEPAVAG